jgi:hypothetical protein
MVTGPPSTFPYGFKKESEGASAKEWMPFDKDTYFEKEGLGDLHANLQAALRTFIASDREKASQRLRPLSVAEFSVSVLEKPLSPSHLAVSKKDESGKSLSFFYGLEGSLMLGKLQYDQSIPAGMIGRQDGLLSVGIQLKDGWEIRSGLGISVLSLSQEVQASYQVLDDGFASGSAPFELAFEMGFLDYQARLENQGNGLQPGDQFAARLNVPFEIRYLKIPFHLGYSFGKGRTRLALKSGINWNTLIYERLNPAQVTFSHEGLRIASQQARSRNLRPAFLEGMLALNARHKLSRIWELEGGVRFSKAFGRVIYNRPLFYGLNAGVRVNF